MLRDLDTQQAPDVQIKLAVGADHAVASLRIPDPDSQFFESSRNLVRHIRNH